MADPLTRAQIVKGLRPEDQERAAKQLSALEKMVESGGFENLHPALAPWVHMETVLGPMVKHPLCYMYVGSNGLMVEQANDFYAWKIEKRRQYLDEGNFIGYLCCFERPYRMHKLSYLWRRKKISKPTMRELLAYFWTDTECPQGNQSDPVYLFREAKFTTDNRYRWNKLDDNFTLYRGVDGEFELTRDGPSWTFDPKVAEFFARRYDSKGTVWKYEATKAEALAYFHGRDEAEIILDFDFVSDRRKIVPHKVFGKKVVG